MAISIGQQIDEVRRELEQRAKVYPRLINSGKLSRSHADYQTQRMEAVLRTLEFVRDNEDVIRQRYAAAKEKVDA